MKNYYLFRTIVAYKGFRHPKLLRVRDDKLSIKRTIGQIKN